jgi:hypothetical protein
MHDFKKIIGHYPKSVASWFIDAYSLNYMYQKYRMLQPVVRINMEPMGLTLCGAVTGIAQLRNEHKIVVETLAESGKWFTSHFKVTPATAVTITHDIGQTDAKTVWYDSRFYRSNFIWQDRALRIRDLANFIWQDRALRIRDLHLFNEKFPSHYFNKVTTSNECYYFTLPFTDGYL